MSDSPSVLDADWLGVCRRIVDGVRQRLEAVPSMAERIAETGTRGEGGDRTLVIDAEAEEVVLAELRALHEAGHRFSAISEEEGEIDFGGGGEDRGDGGGDRGAGDGGRDGGDGSGGRGRGAARVVIDPIDGSLNAKRGLPHHALSIAVASGTTMADVEFAYVYDFGPREEWWARRGQGAWLGERRLDASVQERHDDAGRVEVLGIESADPRWLAASLDELLDAAHRLRALGTIASSLCQVAAARFDGMVSLRNCRAVDAAAGQLIVREAGGFVSFPRCDDPLGMTLDVKGRSPVAAARSEATLARLARIPG